MPLKSGQGAREQGLALRPDMLDDRIVGKEQRIEQRGKVLVARDREDQLDVIEPQLFEGARQDARGWCGVHCTDDHFGIGRFICLHRSDGVVQVQCAVGLTPVRGKPREAEFQGLSNPRTLTQG